MKGKLAWVTVVSSAVVCTGVLWSCGFAGEGGCEVAIAEVMYEGVTCRLEGDELVWYKKDAAKELDVTAKKEAVVTFISFTVEEGTYYVMLAKYAALEGEAGVKEVSFYYVDFWEEGVRYKKLTLPEKCRFWLERAGTHYKITNIMTED
jgi:hypothetical protein